MLYKSGNSDAVEYTRFGTQATIMLAARQRRAAQVSAGQAIREAAIIRFRAIMMTMMAAFTGTLPIALATGLGADARRPLGLCVAGGLLFSQFLTLYITPVLYTYLNGLAERFSRVGGHLSQQE